MSILSFLRENIRWLSAGMLLTFLSSFGQTFFISIFAGEIRSTFDLTHGEWGGIYTVGTTASAIVMIWAGSLTDKFRVRGLAAIILLLLAAACLMMALNPVWWGLFFIIFALRFTGQGMMYHIAVVAMSRWFIATRGKALAIATLGFSVGEAFLPIIFVALLALIDWRLLWGVGALIALFGIPVLRSLLREERTPQSLAKSNQSLGMSGRHWSRRETLFHPLFWFMVPALIGPSAFGTAFFFHQVHFTELKAIAHVEFVAMFPFYTLMSIGAMIASGWGIDRFGTAPLIPYMQIPLILSFLIFGMGYGSFALLAGFFFFALTIGFNVTLPSAFWAEFYGTGNLGAIKAMAAAVMVLGSAIGPGLTGVLIDFGVGLEFQFILVAGYFAFSSLMMMIGISQARRDLPATT